MNILSLILIIGAGIITYLMTSDVLKNFSVFQYPRILAALVVLIGCAGLLRSSEGFIALITVPYAALVLAACAVAGILWIGKRTAALPAKDKAKQDEPFPKNENEAPCKPWKCSTTEEMKGPAS